MLLAFCGLVVWTSHTARAVDFFWTGGGEDDLWSNPANWGRETGFPSGAADDVFFGRDIAAGDHTVVVDGDYEVRIIRFYQDEADPKPGQTFHFVPAEEGSLTLTWGSGFQVRPTVTGTIVFDVPFTSSGVWYPSIEGDHAVVFNGRVQNSAGTDPRISGGTLVLNATFSGVRTLLLNSTWGDYPLDFTLNLTNTLTTGRGLLFNAGSNAVLRVGNDITLGRELVIAEDYAGPAYMQAVGDEDRTLTIPRSMQSFSDSGVLTFLENEPGDTGRLILHTIGLGVNATHTLPMITASNTYLRFDSDSTAWPANLTYSANSNRAARIGGAGHLWNTGELVVRTVNTYSGRTMLQSGTLRLDSHTLNEVTYYGQLPEGTVVEIAAGATFNLNGIDQTVGGLTGFRGLEQDSDETFGTVTLGGAALTINAQQDTAFAGTITGTGTLVKAGAETFTLSAGYTNVVGRTLRAVGGVLEVTGALSVEEGDFELAGGRITAGSLASEGNAWNVTLHESNEDQVLVDVAGNADITSAILVLGLADGYKPEYGKEYTLLYAGSITGAGAGGLLFGIEDGDSFTRNGQEYMIRWKNGSEQIILTAIPEPGSLALLALAGSWLWFKRRRRRG